MNGKYFQISCYSTKEDFLSGLGSIEYNIRYGLITYTVLYTLTSYCSYDSNIFLFENIFTSDSKCIFSHFKF